MRYLRRTKWYELMSGVVRRKGEKSGFALRKKLCFVLFLMLCLVLSVLSGFGIHPFQAVAEMGQSQTKICELKEPLAYDRTLERQMELLAGDGIDAVLWSEHASETLTNADYNRSVEVKTIGVAGDASVLFPGSNRLPERTGKAGFCVLGEDTAWQLFGSRKAVGRSVEIRGELYYVAGIEYQEKEMCAYGLVPDGGEEITGIAVHVENREQLEMDIRKAERWLGVEIAK